MIVWRVETAQHLGPFQGSESFIPLTRALDERLQLIWKAGESHPAAFEDFSFMQFDRCYHFGCDSYRSLQHWFSFPKVIEYLKSHAFLLTKYDCGEDIVQKGASGVQVMFDMIFAEKVAEYPLDVLLNPIEPLG